MNQQLEFRSTSIDNISSIHQTTVARFHTHKTRPISYRLKQLRSLYWALKDNESLITEACKLDLGKSAYETYMTELGWVLNDIVFMSKNLTRFMKDEKPEDIDYVHQLTRPRIRKDPLGAVLIIGAYNVPFQLSLGPLVGAITAGCTAVLKPSEHAPNAARVMQYVLGQSLDPEAYQVVQGGVSETTALLDCKWDKIFYTGNAAVGKIISRKAAETLTPITLELGGLNPAIITRNADLRLAARRLVWAKLLNAGQVCVSQNYVLVDKEVLPTLVQYLEVALKEFQPKGSDHASDYAKVVNERQWQRLKDLLDASDGKVLLGGRSDRSILFFEPTVIQVDSPEDPLIQNESFGPVIPLLPVSDLDEAIRTANLVDATPLGIYAFGTKAETDKVLSQTRSGGASINDAFHHASIHTLAFGGVGNSGQGAYRGRASFDCFTHRRSVTVTPSWMERILELRYPPYSDAKLKWLKMLTDLRPDFDRQGNTARGFFDWALSLGAGGKKSIAFRWMLVALLAAAIKLWRSRD